MITKEYLMLMLSPIYDKSAIMQAILEQIAAELNHGNFKIEDYQKQLFPQSATWGLQFWEAEYGITPDPTWTLRQRREKVLFEMNNRKPLTISELTRRIEKMTDGEVIIHQHPTPYTLLIEFRYPTRIDQKQLKTLREIIPAHLGYQYKQVHPQDIYYGFHQRKLRKRTMIFMTPEDRKDFLDLYVGIARVRRHKKVTRKMPSIFMGGDTKYSFTEVKTKDGTEMKWR